MTSEPSPSDEADRLARGLEPVTVGEWIMVGLAGLDVLLLLLQDAYATLLPDLVAMAVYPIDLAIVGIFAVELVVRSGRARSRSAYVRSHWYDVIGLIPIASVGLRAVRLVRLARIYVVQRLDWEGERSWEFALVRAVIVRFRDVLLEEITTPVIMAGIRLVKAPLKRARFASVVGSTIDTQRRQVHAVVRASLRNTKGVKRLAGTKAGQRLTEEVTELVLDSVVDTLHSDEMNDLVANSVEDVLVAVADNVKDSAYEFSGGRIEPVDGSLAPEEPAREGKAAPLSPTGSRARGRGS